jgi:hypothetical protein
MGDGERDEGRKKEGRKGGGGLVEVYILESVRWEGRIGFSKLDGSRERCRGL